MGLATTTSTSPTGTFSGTVEIVDAAIEGVAFAPVYANERLLADMLALVFELFDPH